MRYGVAYVKETEAAYAAHVRERLEKQLRRRTKDLGFELTKIETVAEAAAAEVAQSAKVLTIHDGNHLNQCRRSRLSLLQRHRRER